MQALGHVMREGRVFLGESPEQVGGSINVSGRAIRRLEASQTAKPRDLTLTTLASYYNLDADFVRWLSRLDLAGDALQTRLQHRAELASLRAGDADPLSLALMLARNRPARVRSREETELAELQSEVALLSERRRRLVRQLVHDLRLAQSEELRRREAAGDPGE